MIRHHLTWNRYRRLWQGRSLARFLTGMTVLLNLTVLPACTRLPAHLTPVPGDMVESVTETALATPIPVESPEAPGDPGEAEPASPEMDAVDDIAEPPPVRYSLDETHRRLVAPQSDNPADVLPVMLTIDDGPRHFTGELLQVLDQYDVKALFFVNGVHFDRYGDEIRQIYEAGHTIGNHAWSHHNLTKMPPEQIRTEIENTSAGIEQITGTRPAFFRAPYGAYTPYAYEVAAELGMQTINWSIDPQDWSYHDPSRGQEIVEHIIDNLHPGAIILLHQQEVTLAFLPDIIEAVRAAGYEFVSPDHLLFDPDDEAAGELQDPAGGLAPATS